MLQIYQLVRQFIPLIQRLIPHPMDDNFIKIDFYKFEHDFLDQLFRNYLHEGKLLTAIFIFTMKTKLPYLHVE